MKLLISLLGKSKKRLVLSIAIGIVNALLSVAVLVAINSIIGGRPPENVAVFTLFLSGLLVLFLITGFISHDLINRLGLQMSHELLAELIRSVEKSSLRKIENLGIDKLYSTATSDIDAIKSAAGVLPPVIINLVLIVASIVYISTISFKFLIVVLGLVFSIMFVYGIASRYLIVDFGESRKNVDILHRSFHGYFNGLKDIKIYPEFSNYFFNKVFLPASCQVRDIGGRIGRTYALSYGMQDALFFLTIGFVLVFSVGFLGVSLSMAVECVLVLLFVRTPIMVVFSIMQVVAAGSVALDRFITISGEIESLAEPTALSNKKNEKWESLELVDVEYFYSGKSTDEDKFNLGPVSMSVSPGEIIFITGGNGAGKSTLVKIITGLYESHKGEVYLNSRKVDANELGDLRHLSAAIFSDGFVFDEMSQYYFEDVSKNQLVRELASAMKINDVINFDGSPVNTSSLSSGQKKRLSLIYAIASDRDLYVLDEWAAEQDPGFREYFYKQLIFQLKEQGKGVILITHDDRYFNLADRVYKLERGSFRCV